MYQPVALFIGLRYMRRRAPDRFGRVASWLSTIAIALAVMAMVTVLSVMNGFEQALEKNILGFIPQALITSKQGPINPRLLPASIVQRLKGIRSVSSLTSGDVVLQSAHGVAVGVMLGINPDEADPLTPYLVNIKQQQLQPSHYNVIMGEKLAGQLSLKRGDRVRLMVPSVTQFTPIGRLPSQRLFTIIGTFHANSEVDNYEFLINQQDASRLMQYPSGCITGWRLFLYQPSMVYSFSQQTLPEGTEWKDWREHKGALFQALRLEKSMMGLLISLILVVAVFNIITSLGLLVIEKQSEVAILQIQGLTRGQIMAVFMVQGASAAMIGSLIGTLFGVLLAKNLNNLILLIGVWIDTVLLPVAINPVQVAWIAVFAMALSLISTLYPSWCAVSLQPAEALRYE
ncbi:Lipoprotein-releasing system transmembrane protein LolC [Serratia symbiotica]|nr:Lipoprotein-releasing system transmembrane protein LolC [Serratia symbiotica]